MDRFEVGQQVIGTKWLDDGWVQLGARRFNGEPRVVTARRGFMACTYGVTFTTPGGVFFGEKVDRLTGIEGSALARA